MATDPMWCFENYSAAAEEIDELTAERDKLKSALDAAIAFIDCHAADPDITAEMRIKYAKYQEALKESA